MDGQDIPPDDPTNILSDPVRLAALASVGLPDAAAAPSFDRLARLAARFLGAPVALVSLVDADRQFFPGCIGLPEPWASRGETPLSHSFCQHVVAAGEPLIIADARLDPRVRENRAVDEIGVIAYLGIPLNLDGRVIGSFCAIDVEPRDWSADDLAVMTDLAASVVSELRLRAESAESDRRRQDAVEARWQSEVTLTSIGDAVVVTDSDAIVTYLNPVAGRLCGWTNEDARGRPIAEILRVVDRHTREPQETPAALALATGRFAGWWNRGILVALDGVEREIEESAAPIRHPDGQITGAVMVFRDITERRRVAEELSRSRDRLEMALEASEFAGTWDWNLDTNLLVADERFARFFSVDPELAARGAPFSAYTTTIHPDDLERIAPAIARVTTAGGPYAEEYRLLQPDGSARWVIARGRGQLDSEGKPHRFSGVVIDITEAKQFQERLHRSEERYRSLINSMEEGFCILEILHDDAGKPVDYRYLETNAAFETHSGLHDAVGRRVRELAPDHEPHWFEIYGEVARTGRPARLEQEARDNFDRWFAVNAVRVDDPSLHRVAVLFNDITARKRADAERDHLLAELREADRRKDEFLAMLAHELRNPLAAISGAVALARSVRTPETVEQVTDLVERQARQLTRLIDDLLDVSRIATGKVVLKPETVDLGQLIARAVDQVRPLIEAKRHGLTVDGPDGPVLLVADPTRAEQILGNLLTNAAKYTPAGGHIRVKAGRTGDEVVVAVIDDGVGIPAAMLPEVFGLFTQVDASLERSQGGLGIGLTLVRSLVEMHGGRVAAISAGEGRGSTFTVSLPIGAPDQAALSPRQPEAAGLPLGNLRILIVDDNRDTARMTSRLLAHRGFDVQSAFDGIEGVEIARRFRPDVVLLDIGLPGMSGYEVAEALRRDEAGRDALLVAVSGYGEARAQSRARAAGFDHHLIKPLDLDRLDEILRDRADREPVVG